MMNKIMFVCHGNICRSPMAEFILKDMLSKEKISGIEVCSRATSTEEIYNGIGHPVYPQAKAELKKHSIGCEGKRAVQLKKSDYNKYDVFFCMDRANIRNATRIFGSDPDCKVKLLLELTDKGGEVSDPWYTDRFDVAYADIHAGCAKIIELIKNSDSD